MNRVSIPLMLIASLVGACSDPAVVEQRYQARQAALDPPQLWLAEAFDADGAVAAQVFVCTDLGLREGFARADVVADAGPCLVQGQAVEGPNSYAARCNIGYGRFGLNVHSRGDPKTDVRVRVSLQPTDRAADPISQTRRYRRIGACPVGWGVGDQAKPGQPPHGNALTMG